MSFVEMQEVANTPIPRRPSRMSGSRISFTQRQFLERKFDQERMRRSSLPILCDDPCVRDRNEFRELEAYAVYKPQPYNFEIQNYDAMKGIVHNHLQQGNLQIKCPEFYILFDHALAMIWQFYNNKKNWNKFTIPQIEWTLKFIDGIKSMKGESFTDMETIKKHLEEFLFIAYSEVDEHKLSDFKPPPVEEPPQAPPPTYDENDIPLSVRELFHQKPSMIMDIISPQAAMNMSGRSHEPLNNPMVNKALDKLQEFEWKNVQRISDEIDMFNLIKCIKTQIGTHDNSITGSDLANLKEKIDKLEARMLHN